MVYLASLWALPSQGIELLLRLHRIVRKPMKQSFLQSCPALAYAFILVLMSQILETNIAI